jgi:hypothetical protein
VARGFFTVIVSMHLAFVGVFGFMFWQKRRVFASTLSIAWILQAARIVPLLRQAWGVPISTAEWAAADLLLPPALWCLVLTAADLTGRKVSRRLGFAYVGLSAACTLAAHYRGIELVMWATGLPFDRAQFWAILLRHVGLFGVGGMVLLWLAAILYRYWRRSRLPGAVIAAVFAVPYALGVLVVPLQWYWTFYPAWNDFAWFLEVLGLSTGLLVLVLNQQHAALMTTMMTLRRLQGLLPICASCKRIRDDAGYWKEIEIYIHEHSEAEFSHGLCPECAARLYPGIDTTFGEQP